MGVMECFRNECENIMCDRYSSRYGYICNECFTELVETGPTTDIESFMESIKESPIKESTIEEAQARYNAVFKFSED